MSATQALAHAAELLPLFALVVATGLLALREGTRCRRAGLATCSAEMLANRQRRVLLHLLSGRSGSFVERPSMALRLLAYAPDQDLPPHLSVDGMSPSGPNLSHWPGNRTPPIWKADLSTGICANFARAQPQEQENFLGAVEGVLNDHYDTDGFLSLLMVLQPELALAHEELCLLAAGTGDFQAYQSEQAFAIDRIVQNLGKTTVSPYVMEFQGLDHHAKDFSRYQWLLDNAARVLQQPEEFTPLFAEELAQVQDELRRAKAGSVQSQNFPDQGLCVLHSKCTLHRMTLNTLAGCYRVLHIQKTPEGPLYRYHDRTESWFEVVTFSPPKRRDLSPLSRRLQAMEEAGGSNEQSQWSADPATEPVPELYHGIPSIQAYGQISRQLTPSRLMPETVCQEFLSFFAQPRQTGLSEESNLPVYPRQ